MAPTSQGPAAVVPYAIVPQRLRLKRGGHRRCLLDSIVAEARAADVAAKAVHRSQRDPYPAIIDIAQREHCDLIVMGSHGYRGITGVLLGSETMKVLTHTAIPVLVYRH